MIPSLLPAAARLGLGTVQFGLDYGVSNTRGRVPQDDVAKILDLALSAGISVLDTAGLYGESEAVMGAYIASDAGFRIVTKTPPVRGAKVTDTDVDEFRLMYARSLARLKRDSIYGLLVHHGSDLLKPGAEALIDVLRELKGTGLVERIGVSVYTGAEIDGILDRFIPDIVQLPINIVDQRLMASGHLARLDAMGIEVHARSLFLQGLLLSDPDKLPAYFRPYADVLKQLAAKARSLKLTPLEACLSFGLGCPEIDVLLVGVTSPGELDDILKALPCAAANPFDTSSFSLSDERLLDPSQWRI